MKTASEQPETVTLSEILELASWDRPRTTDELRSFISSREAALSTTA
jgi:hypothetical protein